MFNPVYKKFMQLCGKFSQYEAETMTFLVSCYRSFSFLLQIYQDDPPNGRSSEGTKDVETEKLKLFKCPDCEYTCAHSANLRRHVNAAHKKLKLFKCPDCEYSCARSSRLREHVNAVHKKLKLFKCPDCEYSCSRSSNLRRHVNATH